jgi:alginate O-acetyltransferase complex protein AlgI
VLFNSIVFLYLFLPIAYWVFWRLRTRAQRYVWLTLTGYVFYGFWNYRFCALMAFSTLVSYLAGRGLLRWSDPRRRKLCVVIPVVTDLALLGFFKYTGFALRSLRAASVLLHHPLEVPAVDIVLPIGISFYTFHTISYIVDSYRGVVTPTRNFWEFSCYVSLFCQLVAGPIVRFRQIEADLDHIGEVDRRAMLDRGWSFFVIGMIKKILLADTIAAVVNPALARYQDLSTGMTWLVMAGYSYQLYFDFSGYSDMAVGLGALFGLRIPQNFNSPYKALDPSDFWKRWHISLSTCMRDYLYIPLGGNRHHTYRNLMLTMIIGGVWHGANWTFVAWGVYHGLLLTLYKRFGAAWDELPTLVRRASMFVMTLVGWVFFRAASVHMAGAMLRRMFGVVGGVPVAGAGTLVALVALGTAVAMFGKNTFELSHKWPPRAAVGLAATFAVAVAMVYVAGNSPFLYFQF